MMGNFEMKGNEGNHKGCPYCRAFLLGLQDVPYGRPWWTPIEYETNVVIATHHYKDVALLLLFRGGPFQV